jgi:hypothetical protein
MKYTIIIIIAICEFTLIARAEPDLDLAVKGGPNAATQAEELRVNRYGFSGGASGQLRWRTTDRISLGAQLELLYTPRGASIEVQGQQVGKIRDHYIDLALSTRPELHLGSLSVYLLLGGGLNYLLSASRDDSVGSGQDITDGLHRIDLSVLGALGAALHLPGQKVGPLHLGTIFLEARHDIGLLDVGLSGGFKNRTSSVMLGLSFVVGDSPTPSNSTTNQTADRSTAHSTLSQ